MTGMCFSPEADLVGGVIIGAIGLDTVSHVRHRRELPLAAIPVLLAGHQITEAFVWWGVRGSVSHSIGSVAMWAYLIFAFCVLPILIPAGVMAIEPTRHRRWKMLPMLIVGIGVAGSLLLQMIAGPVTVQELPFHLHYQANLVQGGLLVGLYLAAVCLPLLLSSYRHVVIFGVVNLVAAVFLAWTIKSGFTSIWCAWAAIASGAIAFHLRYTKTHRGHRPKNELRHPTPEGPRPEIQKPWSSLPG